MVVSTKRAADTLGADSMEIRLEDILTEVAKINDDAFRIEVSRLLDEVPEDEERALVERVNEIFNLTYRYVIRNLEKELTKNPEALF
ncbi:MAG: hypothetical protein RQ758_07890 [Methanomicrobiaceae archaeon]|nr:hypothetical protein [Methanomicrobiaceae archaeon]